ncbi:MAG: hypothetical protein Greene041619_916 [Candidatus Peregrinibacteria bacterium Greene0416_19]|nr:MAG: hypothetical protein Greene041619_916 [Candidatus Peregrinibacteria bacterium Greene0416_19]
MIALSPHLRLLRRVMQIVLVAILLFVFVEGVMVRLI